ncbi:MAG TPA: hypothetical protein VH481_10630 [Nitrososphaeraceae archaeon]|jgi:hypothetical protein
MKHFQIIILVLLEAILYICLSFSAVHDWSDDVSYAQYPDISGIKCDKEEHFNFHYHAHLTIFVNGLSYLVPAGIGIRPPDCIYWLHTHDISGIIHIESPENKSFSLGQFFDIWGKKFNNTQIFDFTVNENKTLVVYVNGTAVKDSQYRDIRIVNHEDITIVYGIPPAEISFYEFSF